MSDFLQFYTKKLWFLKKTQEKFGKMHHNARYKTAKENEEVNHVGKCAIF